MGTHRRGLGRGSVPRLGVRGRAREGGAGHRLLGARQGGNEPEALRSVRPARRRARVQHDRHVGAAAEEYVSAAVQGSDRRGSRHGDVLVQRDQRRARLREQRARDGHPQARVALRRLRRERLHRGRRADPPRHRRQRRRCRRGCAQRGHRHGDGEHGHPRQRGAVARRAPHLDGTDRRRGEADPARQVPRGALRSPVRRPDEGERSGELRHAGGPRGGEGRCVEVDGAVEERQQHAAARSGEVDRRDRPAWRRPARHARPVVGRRPRRGRSLALHRDQGAGPEHDVHKGLRHAERRPAGLQPGRRLPRRPRLRPGRRRGAGGRPDRARARRDPRK